MKPYFGRIVFEREGIEIERKFKTKNEATAYCQGFNDAKQIIEGGGEDSLDEYFSNHSDEESIDE